MTKLKSVCIFGDSTAWGAWDLEKGECERFFACSLLIAYVNIET